MATNFRRRQEDIIPASQRGPGRQNTPAYNAIWEEFSDAQHLTFEDGCGLNCVFRNDMKCHQSM